MPTKKYLSDNIIKHYRDSGIRFIESDHFSWSSEKSEIRYVKNIPEQIDAIYSLLHEIGHAILEHSSYNDDFKLIKLELEAWEKAKEIASKFHIEIPQNHIEDCLDTYRNWLHDRSICPLCTISGLSMQKFEYQCFNCNTKWSVPSSVLCQNRRLLVDTN